MSRTIIEKGDAHFEKSASTDSVKASFLLSRRVLKAETHIVFTQHGTSDHGKGSPSFVRGHSPLTLLNTVRISAFARTFLPRVDSLNTLESETPPLVKIYGTVDIKKVCNIMAN